MRVLGKVGYASAAAFVFVFECAFVGLLVAAFVTSGVIGDGIEVAATAEGNAKNAVNIEVNNSKHTENAVVCDAYHAKMSIVLDAGHGGRDKGASSKSGTNERDINLAITLFLKEELEKAGHTVTLTRTDEWSLADPEAKNQKMSDLRARHKIIEDTKPDLVISIHLNKFPRDPSVDGLQCFYQKGGTAGEKFANAIQEHLNKSPLGFDRVAKAGDYYILETPYPSVLIECGFLSNPDEEAKLKTPEYQRELAKHIAEAVNYCSLRRDVQEEPGSTRLVCGTRKSEEVDELAVAQTVLDFASVLPGSS